MLKKKSVLLAGHATSIALEPEFWAVLDDEASRREMSLAGLLKEIDATRGRRPSACRVRALEWVAQSAPANPVSDRV